MLCLEGIVVLKVTFTATVVLISIEIQLSVIVTWPPLPRWHTRNPKKCRRGVVSSNRTLPIKVSACAGLCGSTGCPLLSSSPPYLHQKRRERTCTFLALFLLFYYPLRLGIALHSHVHEPIRFLSVHLPKTDETQVGALTVQEKATASSGVSIAITHNRQWIYIINILGRTFLTSHYFLPLALGLN